MDKCEDFMSGGFGLVSGVAFCSATKVLGW